MCVREDTINTTIEKIIDKTPTKDLKILTVKKISEEIGKNDIAVRKAYKRKRGFHLSKLIFYKKMQKGYTLLKDNPELTINKISNIVGYVKPETFRSMVKKNFEKKPSEIKIRQKQS